MTETCGRCGRRLKNPIFREIGYGKTCAAKVYGIKGAPYGARGLTVSLDALVESGCQICGGWLKCLNSKPCAA